MAILSIDDDSLEILQNEFGNWPWTRDAYTKAINYMLGEEVDMIVFDLMFIGYRKGYEDVDRELARTISQNKNIYTAMHFDDRILTSPPELRDELKLNIQNYGDNMNFAGLSFQNCRLIMDEILNNTDNIGFTNCPRDKDGISRHVPMF
ncbi:MAG: CHASE2 domain-containing protein [Desulfobacterales bacterium]|nr:CHASE2 domain-containing protein [Desulfobacterales bacterium]